MSDAFWQVHVDESTSVAVVIICGRLDTETARAVGRAVRTSSLPSVIDCARLEELDTAALGVLLSSTSGQEPVFRRVRHRAVRASLERAGSSHMIAYAERESCRRARPPR